MPVQYSSLRLHAPGQSTWATRAGTLQRRFSFQRNIKKNCQSQGWIIKKWNSHPKYPVMLLASLRSAMINPFYEKSGMKLWEQNWLRVGHLANAIRKQVRARLHCVIAFSPGKGNLHSGTYQVSQGTYSLSRPAGSRRETFSVSSSAAPSRITVFSCSRWARSSSPTRLFDKSLK